MICLIYEHFKIHVSVNKNILCFYFTAYSIFFSFVQSKFIIRSILVRLSFLVIGVFFWLSGYNLFSFFFTCNIIYKKNIRSISVVLFECHFQLIVSFSIVDAISIIASNPRGEEV